MGRLKPFVTRVSVLVICMALGPAAPATTLQSGKAAPTGQTGALSGYDFRADDVRQYELPGRLSEVSGLALDATGRLFGHQDERAIVYRIDVDDGEVVASFDVGRNGRRGDFEGIAFAGSRMFLITSNGELLEFGEGADDETVEFSRQRTRPGRLCVDIEGLEYDAPGNALLIACKQPAHELLDRLILLRFSLRSREIDDVPFIDEPLTTLSGFGLDPAFSPSGVAIHPLTRTILVLAARQRAVVEFDRDGHLLGAARLRGRHHEQPEGIAIMRDGTLLIADEGGSEDATLTLYPYRPGATPR
jgi:uncharacterized protein YjiK